MDGLSTAVIYNYGIHKVTGEFANGFGIQISMATKCEILHLEAHQPLIVISIHIQVLNFILSWAVMLPRRDPVARVFTPEIS